MKKKSFAIVVVIFSALLLSFPVYSQEGVETIPFQMVEQKPSFNGGDANDFSKWVNEHIVYPASAKANKLEGRVTVQFIIKSDGSVSDVRVLRGFDPELDKEAIRVISSSPKWSPARQKGEPVNVSYMFRVNFSLSEAATSVNATSSIADVCAKMDDPAFKSRCLKEHDINKDGRISKDEAAAVTHMDVSGGNIRSLRGIEFFPNLISLNCKSNKLTSIDVSKNKSLESLFCGQNELTSLDVSKNTALINLLCGFNKLTMLDVSNNTALTDLYCNYNQLTKIDVSKNKALKTLVCGSNQLTKLDVSNNPALEWLDCSNNLLRSLDVSKNSALESLDYFGNYFTVNSITGRESTALSRSRESITQFSSGQSVVLYLMGSTFTNGNISMSFRQDGIYINGQPYTGAFEVIDYSLTQAAIRAYSPLSGSWLRLSVNCEKNTLTDLGDKSVYKKR